MFAYGTNLLMHNDPRQGACPQTLTGDAASWMTRNFNNKPIVAIIRTSEKDLPPAFTASMIRFPELS